MKEDRTWYIVLCAVLFVSMQIWYATLHFATKKIETPETSTGEVVPQIPFDSPVEVQSSVPDVEPKVVVKTVIKKVYIKEKKVVHYHVKMVPILPVPEPVVVPEKTYSVFCRTVGNIKIPPTRQKSCQSVEIVDGHVKWD